MVYSALDNVKTGLLILDRDLRAVYSNPALHGLFRSWSPDQIRSQKPRYVELLLSANSAAAIDLEDYVARRLSWVKSGEQAPMDLRMADGSVQRCQLAVLPNGGRMLIYSDVTDIIRNAEELERLATTDGMTGLFNRRHFLALAECEWKRARRYDRSVSLAILDIDFFKAINDEFGHDVGDSVIVHLTELAGRAKRDTDLLARIGGEEFALLLPETTLSDASTVAERIRHVIATRPFGKAPHSVAATVSIGVAASTDTMAGFTDLMKAADDALYDAKRSGRNRVALRPGL